MMGRARKRKLAAVTTPILKLDLGCGPRPRDGFTGVDVRDFGQPITHDLRQPWPWADGSVSEVVSSHFLEHLTGVERVHFVNELYRVLIPGGTAQIVVPHWASCRAYGDYTHQWPPVSEFWFYYLSDEWRRQNAPHNDGYACNFAATWGYSLHQGILNRAPEYQQHAIQFWKEAAQDLIATLTKQPRGTP